MFKVGDRVRVKNDGRFYNANKEGIVLDVLPTLIRTKINNSQWSYSPNDLENLTNLEVFETLGD